MSSLYDAILATVRDQMRGLYLGLPGEILAYSPDTGSASVRPLLKDYDPNGSLQSLPVIAGVPVAMMGGEAASLYLPVRIGDTGWLAFSGRSLENWLDRGGEQAPGDPRLFSLTDAVFFPGLRPFSAGSLAEEEDAAVLKAGTAKIKIRGGKVAIGNQAAELLDLFDQLLAELQNPAAVLVNPANGIGGLGPASLAIVAQLKVLLGLLKGSL